MKSLSDIAHRSVSLQARTGTTAVQAVPGQTMIAPEAKEALSNHVFKVLTGYYGRKFLDQHCSGTIFEVDHVIIKHGDPRAGQDKGLCRARSVWGQGLIRYSRETIADALERCKREYVKWPPTLPEFEAICEVCKPRPVARAMAPEEVATALAKQDSQREARRKLRAREDAARQVSRGNVRATRAFTPAQPVAPPPDPMIALHEAMAVALAAQGMDEGKALRWVEQKITPELIAAWVKGESRGP